jgi:CHAT domain-containing protein
VVALPAPSLAALVPTPVDDAIEIRDSLAADEALLLFETLSPAGPRLLVHTRTETRSYFLPPASRIELSAELFVGLIARRDGSEAHAAATLYHDLLEDPLGALPPKVTRLIVVSDGPMQLFPFQALRAAPRSEPLASRFAISRAPTVSHWMRWRREPADVAGRPALVLAAPAIDPSLEKTFGPLDRASRAGRTVLDHAREGSQVRAGRDASEYLLKTTDLSRFGIVHIAAHAVVNYRYPERSALLLAAGPSLEDGLLSVSELEHLDLEGRIAVLAGCGTASGRFLAGTGVQSLARACLAAGARAVVGSLWPLQDEQIGDLLDDFYHHLGNGASLDEALALARRDRIRAGDPTAAWAGMVLLGDGSLVPWPRPATGFARAGRPWPAWVLTLLTVAGCIIAAILTRNLAPRLLVRPPRR